MTASRAYCPIPSKLSDHRDRGISVATGDVAHLPSPVVDGPFYPDLSTPELHAEMVWLSQSLQVRGVIA